VYEEEYVRAVSGTAAEDRNDSVRSEAKALLKALFAKLDALSHFHFAPRPVVEELVVRADVPAVLMEEAAPQVCMCACVCPCVRAAVTVGTSVLDPECLDAVDRPRMHMASWCHVVCMT
jgi:Mpp10 protein